MKAIVLGAGISGLIAAHVLQEKGADVTLVESIGVGEAFLNGSLKCVRKTQDMIALLNKLNVVWSDHTIRTGVMLKGQVIRYPECLEDISEEKNLKMQADYFKKTRKIEILNFGDTSMDEPGTSKTDRRALRFDPQSFIQAIAHPFYSSKRIIKGEVVKLFKNHVCLSNMSYLNFDICIVTMPLWEVSKVVDWFVPEGVAMAQNVLRVLPKQDPYVHWDVIYTPYTPGNTIHRLNAFESCWDGEYNGDPHQGYAKAIDDLGSFFPSGFRVVRTFNKLKGHQLPLPDDVSWPENVFPLGRFAKWDPSVTADDTLNDILKLSKKWS